MKIRVLSIEEWRRVASGALLAVLLAGGAFALLGADKPATPSAGHAKLVQRFEKEVYPLITRGQEDSCISCHDGDGTSELVLFGNARDDFQVLREGGYFLTNTVDTLLGRVTSDNPKKRMPKGRHADQWSPDEISQLRAFLGDLNEHWPLEHNADEAFPASLLAPYGGPAAAGVDNQFLTYRQLRGKTQAIFGDDWVRDGRDLFAENVALFGGADFKDRFNESSQPSSSFLSGLEMLARDIAALAYSRKAGPFDGRPDEMSPADGLSKPDADYRQQITRLYEAVLFRAPSKKELSAAFALIQGAYREKDVIARSDYELGFEVTVTDPESNLSATREVVIPVRGDVTGVYQEILNQSSGQAPDKGRLIRKALGRVFDFVPGAEDQRLLIHNAQTVENVSFAGLELKNMADSKTTRVSVDSPLLRPEGAWKLNEKEGVSSYEDENVEKGTSHIRVGIRVPQAGRYEVSVLWRKNVNNATNVLVEVFSPGTSALAMTPPPSVPENGEARFFIDCSEDTRPFAALDVSFQFGADDYVEINNQGTRARVTAGAMDFVHRDKGATFTVDSKEAEGRQAWKAYDAGRFSAYNRKGTQLQDENKAKGERHLRFKPSVKQDGAKGWVADRFYQIHIFYPGKNDNERRVPVIVKARQSSPIVQLAFTPLAKAGAQVEIDASSSYTVQGSKLEHRWRQIRGVPVAIAADGPVLRFTAPRRSTQQAAWEALCRALMRHPDFLFTRPPSLFNTRHAPEKLRLQLVKLALDLVGRPPNADELRDLKSGTTLAAFADRFLDSKEFRDFYFHRIRLYLESQGTEMQDEPARLWCYVAFNDLPFEEILTANYTVDRDFRKQPRPDYHGRTGVLTTRGFIEGKPGLPHYNYAAQVSMLFLGYVYEVPPEIVEQREGATALGTTDPNSSCYSCHKVLTPLALQRGFWSDDGAFRTKDENGSPIDASDQGLVAEYPFKGVGMESFAVQAVRKERFIRTMINTHFSFYFGRQMRHRADERVLYKRLWDQVHQDQFKIRGLIRAVVTSPEYLEGRAVGVSKAARARTSQPAVPARANTLKR
jgi:hypothetical protein